MKQRLVVVGASGQLGADIVKLLSSDPRYTVVPASRQVLDITRPAAVRKFVSDIQPSVVINAAAFTKVDECEKRTELAYAVNAQGTANLARAANLVNAKLVHISTDYVFDGSKQAPYLETDRPCPINAYGASKLAGEVAVRQRCAKHFIVRTAWLYGATGHNFVKMMIKLARQSDAIRVVDDQRGTPTWTWNLARQLKRLFPTNHYGTFHASSQGACTWFEFAEEIFRCLGLAARVTPISSKAYVQPAGRPANSVLDNAELQRIGLDVMPRWRQGLSGFLMAHRPSLYPSESEVTL